MIYDLMKMISDLMKMIYDLMKMISEVWSVGKDLKLGMSGILSSSSDTIRVIRSL